MCASNTRVGQHQLPSVPHVVEEGMGKAVKGKGERARAGNADCFATLQVETSSSEA